MTRDTFASFPKTSWTQIRHAKSWSNTRRRDALAELVGRYWRPLYAFFRSKGASVEEAEDLVQTFLMRVLNDDRILSVDPQRGRFRDWLIACAKYHLIDVERRKRAKKRQPEQGLVSLQQLVDKPDVAFEPASDESPQDAFLEAWRRDLLDKALRTVESLCQVLSRETDFRIFCEYYVKDTTSDVTWKSLAEKYDLASWKHAARRADFVKVQLGKVIRDEISNYAENTDDIDDELRSIMG